MFVFKFLLDKSHYSPVIQFYHLCKGETPKYPFLGGVGLKYLGTVDGALNVHLTRQCKRCVCTICPSKKSINLTCYSCRHIALTRHKGINPMLQIRDISLRISLLRYCKRRNAQIHLNKLELNFKCPESGILPSM